MDYAIIGANGRQLDPREHEADIIIGGLSVMSDDAIVGAAPGILQAYPGVLPRAQTTNPRVSNLLLNASSLRNLAGAFRPAAPAGPQVVQSQPGPVGLAAIPVASASNINPGSSLVIVVQPQSIFKPYKLILDEVIRPFFLIEAFSVGTVPLFDAPGPMAGTLFTADALPNLKKITANPGISIQLTVRNRDGAAHPFYAAVYGEAAPSSCG